jgi:hypothetical protein
MILNMWDDYLKRREGIIYSLYASTDYNVYCVIKVELLLHPHLIISYNYNLVGSDIQFFIAPFMTALLQDTTGSTVNIGLLKHC